MWLSLAVILNQVVMPRSVSILLFKQQETLLTAGAPPLDVCGIDTTTRDRLVEADEAIPFPCYSIQENVSEVIFISTPYKLRDVWLEFHKPQLQRGHIFLGLTALAKVATKALSIFRPRYLQLEMIKIKENRKLWWGRTCRVRRPLRMKTGRYGFLWVGRPSQKQVFNVLTPAIRALSTWK